MTGLFVLFGGMVLFVGTITLLDWLGRRQLRREQQAQSKRPHSTAL